MAADNGEGVNKTSRTPAEQRVFDKIQRDIAAGRNPQATHRKRNTAKSYTDTDFRRILAYFVNDLRTQAGLLPDLEPGADEQTAAHSEDSGTEQRATSQASDGSLAKSELRQDGSSLSFVPNTVARNLEGSPMQNELHRPPYLRPSFLTEVREAEAQNASSVDLKSIKHQAHHLERHPRSYDDFVDLVAQRELQRLSHELVGATTMQKRAPDVAVWEACERLVFPLVKLLDEPKLKAPLSHTSKDSHVAEKLQPSKRNSPLKEYKEELPNLLPETPDNISPLSVVSRIYPAALVLALRLLWKHSPASPFPLALLPKIRSLGPLSFVLGGTTPFYNALIKLYWDVYSEFDTIDSLLREMERGGIDWDLETYEILNEIEAERNMDTQRQSTKELTSWSRSKSWWERMTQKQGYQKVCVNWKGVIAGKLRDQGLGNAMLSKEYEARASRGGKPAEQIIDRPVIVL